MTFSNQPKPDICTFFWHATSSQTTAHLDTTHHTIAYRRPHRTANPLLLVHRRRIADVDGERNQPSGPHRRSGTARCGAVRCGAVRCGAVRCGAVRRGAVRRGAMRCGAVRCGAGLPGTTGGTSAPDGTAGEERRGEERRGEVR